MKISVIICIILLVLNTIGNNRTAGKSAEVENEIFIVHVDENGAIKFKDKLNDVEWGSDYPGWVEVSDNKSTEKISLSNSSITQIKSGSDISIRFKGLTGEKIKDDSFLMLVELSLNEKQVDIEIKSLETRLIMKNLEYPAHLLSVNSGDKDGYLAIPNLQGILIPSRYDAGFMRYGQNVWEAISDIETWWSFESGNLNMPWFGACKGNSSLLAYVMTSSDCQLHLIGNSVVGNKGFTVNDRQGLTPGVRMSSGSPIWLSSMQHLSYPRKLRIELVQGGYVGMAKKYKEYAKESGRYVTLKEKILKNPEYEKIIGAPDIKIYCYTNRINNPKLRAWSEPVLDGYSKVNTTFSQVAEISHDLKSMGVDRCMIILAGWNHMGYDREHVDIWPPAEKAGGTQGLALACEAVTKNGYLFALHDNYDDFYPDASSFDEKYIIKKEDGSMLQGGIWDGGISYITCPAVRKELLDRNIDIVQKSIPLNAYYLDVITNTSHYECYDERHRIDRKQDLDYRMSLLDDVRNRGLVVGGERGTDWALPALAFCEGLSGGGTGYHFGVTYRIGITVPLFYLVYRDCIVGYWQHGTPHGREDHANHVLMDLLNGQPSSWSIDYEQWNDLKPVIKDTYELLGRLHEQTAYFEMSNHRILSDDFMVQKSEFEDGTEIWVNYGITTWGSGDSKVPPKGFIIRTPGKKVKTGSVSVTLSIY